MSRESSIDEPGGAPGSILSLEEPVFCMLNKQKKYGVLKFMGKTEFSSGVWCGIELNDPHGKNDGAVAGVRYFKCESYHGIFVNPKNVFSAEADCATRPLCGSKNGKRRVLPNLVQESPVVLGNETVDPTVNKGTCGEDFSDGNQGMEGRPRSKSENTFQKDKMGMSKVFCNSPFKYDFKGGKSSSLSKLNNDTYVCNSPFCASPIESDVFCHPRHSSPFSSSHDEVHKTIDAQTSAKNLSETSANDDCSRPVPPHIQLSPQFEVKQSIKLESIQNSRPIGLPTSLKDPDAGLNKTFLIRKEIPSVLSKKIENIVENRANKQPSVNETSEKCTNKEGFQKRKELQLQRPSNNRKVSSTCLSPNESDRDGIEGRSRSVSMSSRSSVESFSSVGSIKSNKEACRQKSKEVGKEKISKIPRTSGAAAKSKSVVKLSGENNLKVKGSRKEVSNTIQQVPATKPSVSKSVGSEKPVTSKSRTMSSSAVSSAPRSVVSTPASSKKLPAAKLKSKSVSCDPRERLPATKRVSTSKFTTPQASKVPGAAAVRRSVSSVVRSTPMTGKKADVSDVGSTRRSSVSVDSKINRKDSKSFSQSESNNYEKKVTSRQDKNKFPESEKQQGKPDESKLITRTRNLSTSRPDNEIPKNLAVKGSSIKSASRSNEVLASAGKGQRLPKKQWEKTSERLLLKKKTPSEDSIKKRPAKETVANTDSVLANCLNSALTPDILKQTPEVTRQSVGLQANSLKDEDSVHEEKRRLLVSALSSRNRDFSAVLIALQMYAQKVDSECENAVRLRNYLNITKEKYFHAEKKLAKETSHRARLEDEIISLKSDNVVEQALLKAEYERKQEMLQSRFMEDYRQDLEKERKRNTKAMEEFKRGCDLKLKRVEETYVQDIAQIKKGHLGVIADLELKHCRAVEELVEERNAEIETIKTDYEEQVEELKDRLSESDRNCHKLSEQLKLAEEESKRDINLRIQDAIAKYKTLPDELESMKFVLEMKNSELKKLRQTNGELQNKIDELQQVKDRAALLEREKESLNFVVENKVQFERQLSLERDKLRLSLDREVAVAKRLSLENEELAWRLNAYQNSPTSPSFDRINPRFSGFNSPDSAFFSQRIEESDRESQMDDSKERTS